MSLRKLVGALLGAAAVTLAVASPAQAQDGPTFTAFDWPDPASGPEVSANSQVTADTITLVKAAGNVGTDATTPDLGMAGDQLTVEYELDSIDQAGAGAVRLFAYSSPDANVSAAGQAPNFMAAVDPTGPTSGTLTLDLAGGAIGTVGVTYDASNTTTGTVVFRNLRLDGELVPFLAPPPATTPPASPAPTPDVSPSAEPTLGTQPTEPPAAGEQLPLTGAPVAWIGGSAAVLLVVGGGLFLVARRRRVTFTA